MKDTNSKITDVTIVVRDGRVNSVYSSSKAVNYSVIDLDTDVPEREDEANAESRSF